MNFKSKKITYLSALIITIGSTIGAGIFMKNESLFNMAQGSLWLVISTWTITGVGIIALGLAIVELASASRGNGGTLEWMNKFMPEWLSKSGKSYIKLIFVPLTLFTMPVYVVSTFDDMGIVFSNTEQLASAIKVFIAFGVFIWIAGINLISLKAGESAQWVFTFVKFIPVILIPIIAMIGAGDAGSIVNKSSKTLSGLVSLAPAIVLIAGIPAIAFSFDGFYSVASLREDLKQPKKLGGIIALSTSIILSIYIFITIAFALGSHKGGSNTIPFFYDKYNDLGNGDYRYSLNTWGIVAYLLLAVGVLGIVNGYMISSIQQFKHLVETKDSPHIYFFAKMLNKIGFKKLSSRFVSWLFIFLITIIYFIIFGIIGIFFYEGRIIGLSDVLTNYSSLLMFTLITLCIVFAMRNRITQKIKTDKLWYFWPSAIISSILFLSGTLFMFVVGFVDLSGYSNADKVSSFIKILVLVAILLISVISGILEWKFSKQKDPGTFFNWDNFGISKNSKKYKIILLKRIFIKELENEYLRFKKDKDKNKNIHKINLKFIKENHKKNIITIKK